MSQMKRLLEEGNNHMRWVVVPVPLSQMDSYGQYHLMERINDKPPHYVIRETGAKALMEAAADRNNKDDYKSPLSQKELIEKSRFSVMERMRIKT